MLIMVCLMMWCRWSCVDGAPSAAHATQNETKVLQVLHLLRKMTLRCLVRHLPRKTIPPAAQNEAAPKRITRRRTSADRYEGAPSAAPATQNESEVLEVL